ncbi:hypothetical protein SAMN05216174_107192 [Actinokineospora iranica]|uniref:Uncharacterized protein n=1 Tax=Actinokineospora iranica TaxID=1271860 RepID=A0A1G6S2W0_9PSEU|nr:hypothetical protein SAMN05216174_107192 [Actinokineospora iranica]
MRQGHGVDSAPDPAVAFEFAQCDRGVLTAVGRAAVALFAIAILTGFPPGKKNPPIHHPPSPTS